MSCGSLFANNCIDFVSGLTADDIENGNAE